MSIYEEGFIDGLILGGIRHTSLIPYFFATTFQGFIRLYWIKPQDGIVSVKIIKKVGSCPADMTDGTLIYSGTDIYYNDTDVASGTIYGYRMFGYDANGVLVSELTCKSNGETWKTIKVRYIRDWINGSTKNAFNVWIEIQAINTGGVNVALNKTVTSNGTMNSVMGTKKLSTITDGSIATSGDIGEASGYVMLEETDLRYVTVDLSDVHTDLNNLKIWHYYPDGRAFHGTKTEVSEDGVNWYIVYDSTVSGEYVETVAGHTINL